MWCKILLVTTVGLFVDAQRATLTPCVWDTVNGKTVRVAEVRRGQTSQLHCGGFPAGAYVGWRYLPDGRGTELRAGKCYPLTRPEGCVAGSLGSGFTPSRPSDSESVMTVDPGVAGAAGLVTTGSLGCSRFQNRINNYCLMDLTDPAEGVCSVKFEKQNADDWVATGSCNITSAYSSRGRYKCHWSITKDSTSEEFQSTVPYTGPSGVCNFIQALPSAGRYSYRVRITPGEVSKNASFGSNSNQITRAPSDEDNHASDNDDDDDRGSDAKSTKSVDSVTGTLSPIVSSTPALPPSTPAPATSSIAKTNGKDKAECPHTVITDPISQKTYEVPTTELGKAYRSPDICLLNGEPYVTLQCQSDELLRALWSRFHPIQGCTITATLRNISLSEISMDTVTDVMNRTRFVLSNCEDCVEMDIVYFADIMQRTARLDNISQETGQKVLELVDTITDVNDTILRGSNTIGNATNRIITAIEDIGDLIVYGNDTNEVLLVSKTMAVGVWDLSKVQDNLTVGLELLQGGHSQLSLARDDLKSLTEYVSPTYNRTDAAIFLHERFIRNITDSNPGKDVRLAIVVFPDIALYRSGRLENSGDRNSKTVLNSKVISATITVDGVKVTALGNDVVTAVFSPIIVPHEPRSKSSICVFWNPAGSNGQGAWSSDGCDYKLTHHNREVCVCDHLTSFAVLLDLYGQDALPDVVHQTALSVITIIGLSLSIAGLSATVLCFLLIKKLRQGRTQQTQFHRAVSMLGSWVVFLAGFRQAESGASCIAVAAMLHYLILVSFMWMMMEGLLQYLLLVKVFGVGFENYILKTAAVAWSLPLLPVVTILAIDTDLYHGGDQYCWMSLTPFYFAFLAPVAIIMLINIVFYVLVIYNICRRRNIGSSGTTNRMLGIRASVICFIALGLSWTFAFFAIGDARLVFQYLFTLTSTLQGFLVFLVFTARDPSVRAYWTRLRCRWGKNPTDTELTTRTKGSREPDLVGGSSETVFGGGRSNAHLLGESQGSLGLSHNSP